MKVWQWHSNLYQGYGRAHKISQGRAKKTYSPLCAKLSKCEFHQNKINHLRYHISYEGIEMDPEKMWMVLEWAPLCTQKQQQSFLGFANFYHQFIPLFAQIAVPITNLLKMKKRGSPNLASCWNGQWNVSKAEVPVCGRTSTKTPRAQWPFVIQPDASDDIVGAALLHKNEQVALQPCVYTSRKLTKTKCRWAVWEKEAYEVYWVLLTWKRGLLLRYGLTIRTQRLSPKQVHYAQYFNWFNFTLWYLLGGGDFLADALCPCHRITVQTRIG